MNVGGQKLGYKTEEFKACLETDDFDIDGEDIFQYLFHQNDAFYVITVSDRMGAWSLISSLLIYMIYYHQSYMFTENFYSFKW